MNRTRLRAAFLAGGSLLLLCLAGCPKISTEPPSQKDTPSASALDASKEMQAMLTLPVNLPSFEAVYFIDPGLMCGTPEKGIPLSHVIVRRVSGGEVLQTLEGVQNTTTLSFRKSFTHPNRSGSIETIEVDFILPVPIFKLLAQAASKDKLEDLVPILLFLAIPVPNRVLSYFFAKNHIMVTDPEFYWTNRTYMYLYLFEEYPNLLALFQQTLPSKDNVATYLSSLKLSASDKEVLNRFITFSSRIPTVLTLSLLFDCRKMWMVHGRPPPCVFLQKHMIERTSKSSVVKAEASGYVCPVQRFHLDDRRVVWNYLCPLGQGDPPCSDLQSHSFDPNDEYIKYLISFYAEDSEVGLFCPTDAEQSIWCARQGSLPQPDVADDTRLPPTQTPPPRIPPEEEHAILPEVNPPPK